VTKKPRVIEACSGVGWENNAAFFLINFGFEGILFDGDPNNSIMAKAFFDAHPNTKMRPPVFKGDFVTAENINQLVEEFKGEIDLFSLDMDGMDLWIWDALEVVTPRVVIVEIQELWGWEEAMTRPYRSDFYTSDIPQMGASIQAFMHIASKKGYRLIGCVKQGFNAVFLRNDVGKDFFPQEHYNPRGCFSHWSGGFISTINSRRRYIQKEITMM
jgi:hypothetical protein